MAVIDLTLDSFKVPAIDGYTPPFGTMVTRTETNKGGLSTVEVNSNVIMPFANMRPKLVTEDSSTTAVEYDAKLCFSASLASGAVLTLGGGDYEGCRVQITNLSSFACDVEYNSATLVSIPTGANVEVLWTGSAWMLSTTGTVAAGNVMAPTSEAVQAAIDEKLNDKTIYGAYYGTFDNAYNLADFSQYRSLILNGGNFYDNAPDPTKSLYQDNGSFILDLENYRKWLHDNNYQSYGSFGCSGSGRDRIFMTNISWNRANDILSFTLKSNCVAIFEK